MDPVVQRHIVVSAVNVRKGGTLTVLRECLGYLSALDGTRVTALVHSRELCEFKGIEYIEIPWSARSWLHRLWCEYVTMSRISRRLHGTDLWLSLHDTTPRVKAKRQAVYCQTSFPFMKTRWQDFRFGPKIALFSLLTKYAYRLNLRRNRYLIVQQQWFRDSLSGLLRFPKERIIVAPPAFRPMHIEDRRRESPDTVFLYPATADCHKNFETLCEAVAILESLYSKRRLHDGRRGIRAVLTIDGTENRYARYLKDKYGHLKSIDFRGFMSKEELCRHYGMADCLVFPLAQ